VPRFWKATTDHNITGISLAGKVLENLRTPKQLVCDVETLVKHHRVARDIFKKDSSREAAAW
jgi:hypothetical protein